MSNLVGNGNFHRLPLRGVKPRGRKRLLKDLGLKSSKLTAQRVSAWSGALTTAFNNSVVGKGKRVLVCPFCKSTDVEAKPHRRAFCFNCYEEFDPE